MTAYLVAKRNRLEPWSESYLVKYQREFEHLNLYGGDARSKCCRNSNGNLRPETLERKGISVEIWVLGPRASNLIDYIVPILFWLNSIFNTCGSIDGKFNRTKR